MTISIAAALLRELHSAFWDMASLRRLSAHPWERDIAYRAHEVGARVSKYLRQFRVTPSGHSLDCDWHCDQNDHECSCGGDHP